MEIGQSNYTETTISAGSPTDCTLEVEIPGGEDPGPVSNNVLIPEPVEYSMEVEVDTKGEMVPQFQSSSVNHSTMGPDTGFNVVMANNVGATNSGSTVAASKVIQEDPGTLIIVLESNGELSDSAVEAIKQQLAQSDDHSLIINLQEGNSAEQTYSSTPGPSSSEDPQFTKSSAQDTPTEEVKTCYQCQAKFDSSDELVYHFVQEHSTSVKCQHCELVFPSISAANQHKNQRHIELQCTMCNKQYYGTLALKHHVKLRHAKGTKCGTCYKFFDSREEMESHIEVEHKVNKCMFCGKGFYFQTSLQNHVESEHGMSALDNNLDLDKLSATNQSKTTAVQLSDVLPVTPTRTFVHPLTPEPPEKPQTTAIAHPAIAVASSIKAESEQNQPAETNGTDANGLEKTDVEKTDVPRIAAPRRRSPRKRSATEISFSVTISSPNKKPALDYTCPHCDETFTEADDTEAALMYSTHLASNHEEFMCKQCNMEFKNKRGFMSHMKSKHDMSTIKPALEASTISPAISHTKSKRDVPTPTPLVSDNSNSQTASDALICPYCNEKFRTKRTFDVHQKEKWKRCPLAAACSLCPQVFRSAPELANHHKREHKGRYKTK